LLPTIRSRSLIFHLNALTQPEMLEFASSRGWATAARGAGGSVSSYRIDPAHERRVALAAGSPGLAVTLDIEAWDKRRQRMVALLEVASGIEKFSGWVKHSETISASKTEKLDTYLLILYGLLEDILLLREGSPARRNADLTAKLQPIAVRTSFEWLEAAVERVDELVEFARRNIQKGIALDAFAVDLRRRNT
jgi:DNA polymerase-3 subunit delta'